jgi:hypothetical protein
MKTIDPEQYEHIVSFTGAGMSAESGVPTCAVPTARPQIFMKIVTLLQTAPATPT